MANKVSARTIEYIQSLSYAELGKAVASGEFSSKTLRQAYSQMRSTAVKRYERLTSERNVKQFGKPEAEYFRQTKNIVSTGELVKELRDISRFLKNKGSTISGLRERRDYTINLLNESGWDIDKSDYPELMEFMKWFKASEFSKQYDSDSEVVGQVFNSERATPADWRKAFNELKSTNQSAPYRQY